MKALRFTLVMMMFLGCVSTAQSAAVKMPYPVQVSQENKVDIDLKRGKSEKSHLHRLFQKKSALPGRTGKLTGLEILTLVSLGLTLIVALLIQTIPSTTAVVAGVFFGVTMLLALIGLFRKKKEGRSKGIFWAIFGSGIVAYLWLLWLDSLFFVD